MCRVSPYVAMAAIRTVPCSSETSCGSSRIVAPTARACVDALVDVGHLEREVDDAVAVRRWWSSTGLSGVTPPVKTNRAEPERST